MEDFKSKLSKKILLCDGAMGTELQKKGLKNGQIPEEWNVSRPDKVSDVHKSYVNAGSDIIITNTFGASKIKLQLSGMEHKTEYFNKKAAELALKSSDKVYVLADIGPTGKFIKPYGDLTKQELYENYKQQVDFLKDTGIHGFIIETMSDINELEICIKAVKENSNLSFIASMTFNKISGNVFKTIMGVSIKDMVERVYSFSGRIVGTNCGNGSREMLEIVKAMKDETKKYSKNIFLIAQPNAGMPVVENQITKYNETPYDFKEIIPFYLEAGINIIGGCCGTTPEHIKVIRKLIDSV